MTYLPADKDLDRELIGEVAMDIGKEAVSHLRIMYPDAYAALGKSGQTSLRNHVRNEIMASLKTIDADEIRQRLEERKADRRRRHKLYDDLRKDE